MQKRELQSQLSIFLALQVLAQLVLPVNHKVLALHGYTSF
jgi:hypothetical protein